MKLQEFNELLKKSAKFNIPDSSEGISVEEYLKESRPVPKPWIPRLLVSAVSLVLLLTVSFYAYLSITPVTFLTIDINPSLTVELNTFNRVVSIEASSPEGIEFIEGLEVKNKKVSALFESIYELAIQEGYATETEAYALIGVYGEDIEGETTILSLLEDTTGFTCLSVLQHDESNFLRSLENIGEINGSDAENSYDGIYDGTDIPGLDMEGIMGEESPQSTFSPEFLESEFEVIATEYNISITKLYIIIDIFNYYSEVSSYDDFLILVEADISVLVALHQGIQ